MVCGTNRHSLPEPVLHVSNERMPEFVSPTIIAIPFFLISLSWEWWAVATGRAGGRYETKDALTSILMGLGNVVVNTLTGAIFLYMMMVFWQIRLFELPVNFITLTIAFIGYDFVYYWKHRFAHRMRWFWAEHVTHHSSEHYNLSTALRQPWVGPFTGLILVGGPLVMLGFHPAVLAFVGGLNLVYQYWIHTEVIGRMPPWFEAVFDTPSHHRVHHATNPRYLDANYAGVFIIWDRMFGSFVEEDPSEPPVYGLVTQIKTFNPLRVAFQEMAFLFRDCARDGFRPLTWFRRFTNPPGWSPDGNHQRTEDIKRSAGL